MKPRGEALEKRKMIDANRHETLEGNDGERLAK